MSTHIPFDPVEAPWWTRAVVYQIYPRSFADGDGDGLGDLAGIRQRLGHLSMLGVDAVWLSPVYRSPQDDNGYDISDYEDIDPMFGDMDQMAALIEEAHQRGLKVIMDLVVNHTSDEHPWFAEARSAESPKRDWFWWRPPRAGRDPGTPGAEPNNWGSIFSGSAWEYDDASGEYYLHLFGRKQPDLNWENPAVRREVHAMMNRWLDRGIDGFRMDVINLISKDPALPDGAVEGHGRSPDGSATGATGPWGDPAPHVANGPRIHEFLQEMHQAVFAGGERKLLNVAETPMCPLEEARLYTDPSRHEVDMVFQFEHVDLDAGPGGKFDPVELPLPVLKASLARWQDGLAEVGWNSLYWCNHDQPRAVSRFGDDSADFRELSAKAIGTALHLHRGTPYVYQGEELGMANVPFDDIEDFRDIESRNHYAEAIASGADPSQVLLGLRRKSRDNARTPMQWDDSDNAGFTTGRPWLPVNPDFVRVNAAAQIDDPDSVFSHYRRLIALRHDEPTVALGSYRLLLPDHPEVFAVLRELEGDRLLMLANFSRSETPLDTGALGVEYAEATPLLTNRTNGGVLLPSKAPQRLAAWEAVVLRLR